MSHRITFQPKPGQSGLRISGLPTKAQGVCSIFLQRVEGEVRHLRVLDAECKWHEAHHVGPIPKGVRIQ
jgi:hypothetical protein